jgi:hypothetical protein
LLFFVFIILIILSKCTLLPVKILAEDKKNLLIPEIINAHKKFVGMKETNAKFRYVTKVRSLSTYGITFFECLQIKEKTGDKKKDKAAENENCMFYLKTKQY